MPLRIHGDECRIRDPGGIAACSPGSRSGSDEHPGFPMTQMNPTPAAGRGKVAALEVLAALAPFQGANPIARWSRGSRHYRSSTPGYRFESFQDKEISRSSLANP